MNCLYCAKEAQWIDNALVYGKRYGKSYMCYYCKDCDAYVGCHNNTRTPLGTMANKELRNERKATHAVIDPLWKSGQYTRGQVYARLQDAFGEVVHVGESDIERCRQIRETAKLIFKS